MVFSLFYFSTYILDVVKEFCAKLARLNIGVLIYERKNLGLYDCSVSKYSGDIGLKNGYDDNLIKILYI